MKNSDQLMLEHLYKAIKIAPEITNLSDKQIKKLFEKDLKCIEELIEEGFFGDALNAAKQGASALSNKAKSVLSGAKEKITGALAKKLVDFVMSKLNDQQKSQVFDMIGNGKVDKKDMDTLKQGLV